MPCPHNEITIVQRSQRQSAVAAAAYQSGEKLFCEYDQQVKHYPEKRGIVHNEILLPPNAPQEYADRNTLWNAAEAVEKQWNSQLARRWVLTIPREIPPDQYAVLVREFCQKQFVSKGMIADFAIHAPHPPGHNPHAHVLLTMRAMDEHGKWLPKSCKVYDLDENGERIKLPSGRWKSHKEDTVDWNDQKYCEIWRHEWEVIQNRYLEANDRPERVDLRSYARQGLDIIPTVHEGAAVRQMEKRGIQTNIGNLNREIRAANRLMKSIRQLIVKDLSRFARNYSDAGSLIDNLFVQMGVRFISLAENVDSYKNPDSVSNIIVPITNVMNDNYCYQTSKKIRQVFDYKRRNGQYIGAFAPYGYVKHPKDKHRLIVDPDAAENVKLIFTMLIQGSSKRAIALYLNEHGIPSPSAYKVQKGLPVSTRGYDDPMWGVRMIHCILTNPTYTGDLAQGRSRVKSYKVHQIEAVPREEWVEVAGTHEAIIDYETFDKVQALLQRDTRTSPKGREVHLFSGFLKCADCGRAITRCVGKNNNVYYSCSTYKNRSRTACTMHSIKHERLEAAVLFAVQHQVHLAVSYSEIVTQINSAPIKKSQSYRLDDLIAAKERELTKITRYKQSLYQDWKDGEITQQEYRDMKADYERQTSDISAVLTRLNAERAELANGVDNEHPALVAFMKYQNIEALNREILVELVDYIKVYENGNISVKFKFADELRKIAEYIEINTTEDTAVAG